MHSLHCTDISSSGRAANFGSRAAASDLPQLTREDLKMLDAFEQVREEDHQFDQLLSQQAALNCHGTMMM